VLVQEPSHGRSRSSQNFWRSELASASQVKCATMTPSIPEVGDMPRAMRPAPPFPTSSVRSSSTLKALLCAKPWLESCAMPASISAAVAVLDPWGHLCAVQYGGHAPGWPATVSNRDGRYIRCGIDVLQLLCSR
jgi:hypothetical protein